MQNPKKFKIIISGTYCEVPHPDRRLEVLLEDTDEAFSDMDLFVVLHEILCRVKKDEFYGKINPDIISGAFENFHLGKFNPKFDKTRLVRFEAYGVYAEERHPDRRIYWSARSGDKSLSLIDVSIILFETLCNLRNQMSLTVSKHELDIFAKKFEIYNFGMRADGLEFVGR